MCVSLAVHGCFQAISWVFQGYFKIISRVFQCDSSASFCPIEFAWVAAIASVCKVNHFLTKKNILKHP